ncbi:MAG: serine protease [Candidatus Omnitrophica bacterium]|nr:serine protease [Candidatus Omnitrophota bacterium]
MISALRIIFFLSLGFILLLIELLTPGFGLPGISGIAFIIIGCFLAAKQSLLWGTIALLTSLFIVILFFKFLEKSLLWRKIRLDTKEDKKEGFSSSEDLSYLIDRTGISLTVLRPSGIVLIDGRRFNAITEGRFIEKDKKIRVIRIEGNKMVVREEVV